jgi:hypothetical protein
MWGFFFIGIGTALQVAGVVMPSHRSHSRWS